MKSTRSVSLLIIGDELLSGAVPDVNGAFFCRELTELGWSVRRILVVSDDIEVIAEALTSLSNESSVIVTTGGLGPTSDDITRDAVALFNGVRVILDSGAFNRMNEKYQARGVPANAISERQAKFPEGAALIDNPAGTAEGFTVETLTESGRCVVHSLPGIPKEIDAIWRASLRDWFIQKSGASGTPKTVHIHCFGLSESHIGTVIENQDLPASIRVGYRPVYPEVWVRLTADSDHSVLDSAKEKVINSIGRAHVFSEGAESDLFETLGEILESRSQTIALAESCTGGFIAHSLVNRPGASQYLAGSVVAYANELKTKILGVHPDVLSHYGAVSEQCAMQMARGIREKSGSDFAVSTTGIAGPDGGTPEKPVGTVWFGVVTPEAEFAATFHLPFGRNRFRAYAGAVACDLVRREILGFPRTWTRR